MAFRSDRPREGAGEGGSVGKEEHPPLSPTRSPTHTFEPAQSPLLGRQKGCLCVCVCEADRGEGGTVGRRNQEERKETKLFQCKKRKEKKRKEKRRKEKRREERAPTCVSMCLSVCGE